MFYLLNYNNSGSSPLTFNPPSSTSSNSTESPYAIARYRLLLREARYEGLSRWLGASNGSTIDKDGWLNSTYFPETTSNSSTAIKVTPFEIQDPEESSIIIGDVLGKLMDRRTESESEIVYTQNLTGFVKGGWQARDYSFDQLGLNETWQTDMRRRKKLAASDDSTTNVTTTMDSTTATLETRQIRNDTSLIPINSTVPLLNSTISSNSTFETITTTYNRTELRGSFPFTYHSRLYPNKALFNLREVQTSATGPIVPLPDNGGEIADDSKLLSLREQGDWADWEKKGPVTYLGGELTMSVEEGEYQGQQTNLDIEAAQ